LLIREAGTILFGLRARPCVKHFKTAGELIESADDAGHDRVGAGGVHLLFSFGARLIRLLISGDFLRLAFFLFLLLLLRRVAVAFLAVVLLVVDLLAVFLFAVGLLLFLAFLLRRELILPCAIVAALLALFERIHARRDGVKDGEHLIE